MLPHHDHLVHLFMNMNLGCMIIVMMSYGHTHHGHWHGGGKIMMKVTAVMG